ncbi:MAG: phage terminase small subunit [Eubacteriales bacterium]|nr:phage terminase small subunit [Eubacteriales bacterium]
MPRARDPNREKAFELYKGHNGNIDLVEIASQLNLSPGTIRGWKSKDKWDGLLNGTLQKNTERSKRSKGGQPGNKNATGPPGNSNAEKFGFFRKYLPEETVSIIQEMPKDPLDILWDQIQIAYAAIIRAQSIMYVRDREDSTTTKVGHKNGDTVTEERWEVQHAWDKQGNFLSAQARAQKTLEGMISRYEELLHKNWELATDEQKARISQIKAQTERLSYEQPGQEEDGVEIVNDAPKEASKDIGHSDPEVPADI